MSVVGTPHFCLWTHRWPILFLRVRCLQQRSHISLRPRLQRRRIHLRQKIVQGSPLGRLTRQQWRSCFRIQLKQTQPTPWSRLLILIQLLQVFGFQLVMMNSSIHHMLMMSQLGPSHSQLLYGRLMHYHLMLKSVLVGQSTSR